MKNHQAPHIVLCHSCDLAVTLPPVRHGFRCLCPRCGQVLRKAGNCTFQQAAAVALSALMLLGCAVYLPFLSLSAFNLSQEMSLLSIFTILREDWSLLLLVFILFTFLLPVGMLSIIILIGIFKLKPNRLIAAVYALCHHFCLIDVFILGLVVSIIKLSAMAEIIFHSGFWCTAAFAFACIWCWSRIRPHQVWDAYYPQPPLKLISGHSGMSQGIQTCRHCHLSYAGLHQHQCPRCHARSYVRDFAGRQKSLALLIAAICLYLPANLYPIMFTAYLGSNTGSNIIEGVIALWQMQSYFVAGVVLIASLFIPTFKILLLLGLLYTITFTRPRDPRTLSIIYRIVEFIGKWSMIDVFVVIIMTASVRINGIVVIDPGLAILAFCAVVMTTMAAASAFDERLIWDRRTHQKYQEQ